MEISDPGSRWGRGRDPNLRKGKEVKSSASGKDRTPPLPPKTAGRRGAASPYGEVKL